MMYNFQGIWKTKKLLSVELKLLPSLCEMKDILTKPSMWNPAGRAAVVRAPVVSAEHDASLGVTHVEHYFPCPAKLRILSYNQKMCIKSKTRAHISKYNKNRSRQLMPAKVLGLIPPSPVALSHRSAGGAAFHKDSVLLRRQHFIKEH